MHVDKKKLAILNRSLDFNLIKELDKDGNGIDKFTFVMFCLEHLDILSIEQDVTPWVQVSRSFIMSLNHIVCYSCSDRVCNTSMCLFDVHRNLKTWIRTGLAISTREMSKC